MRAFTVARRLNEAAWNASPQSPPRFPEFALECRIELIRSSIRTLQQNIPPELVAALFRSREWTAPQSLQTLHEALATNYPQRAAELISALSLGLDSSREDEGRFLRQLLVAARSINGLVERARALAAIARRLPPLETLPVLREALDAARSIDQVDERAGTLAALAESLPSALALDVLGEALADVDSIHDALPRA
ncbi:MAG TPA: hypothetical protein VGE52_13495, partial [Pirellulales bacterium]